MSRERSKKVRADMLLVSRGLSDTRAKAQALILSGRVFSGDRRIEKPGVLLPEDLKLELRGVSRFVSRGGDKMQGAFLDLGVDVTGKILADIGASTGGFTDCALTHGAAHVYAIDVGRGQLDPKISSDPRVTVMDETNARYLEADQVGGGVDLVMVDASFISLTKLLDGIVRVLRPGGHLLALIKPQFEVGREEARRARGVIRDETVRGAAIHQVLTELSSRGFILRGDASCRVPGPKGNVEHFVYAEWSGTQTS